MLSRVIAESLSSQIGWERRIGISDQNMWGTDKTSKPYTIKNGEEFNNIEHLPTK
jgi:hypothetical protein